MNWNAFQYGMVTAWCLVSSGCTVCQNAMRTMYHEPAAYSWKHDRRRSVEAYRQWADQAWLEESRMDPELPAPADYVMGFRDGFVDYVYAGGSGEPPPVPPRYFWNVVLRTPDGKQRADQWFAGYRHGALVARDGGYRELGRVHSSLFGIGTPLYASDSADAVFHDALPDEIYPSDAETLPEPNEIPSEEESTRELREVSQEEPAGPVSPPDSTLPPPEEMDSDRNQSRTRPSLYGKRLST